MDVFRIGVSLAMTSNVAGVLSLIGRELTGVHLKVDALQGKFSRLHLAMAGTAALAGAGGLLGAYVKIVEKGAELVHQQEKMKIAGMSNVEVQQSYARSMDLTRKYQNVGLVEINKIIGETRLPYGSTATALKMADPAVAFTSIMKATMKEKGDAAAEQMFELVRSGEMRNISLDPAKMTRFFNDAAKVMEAFEGKIDPKGLFQFLKYARTNTPYLSERFVTRIAPSLMLEMGDSSAGTALTSLGQAIISGKMTKRSAEEMIRLGLIDPKSVLKTTSTSTQLAPGAVKGWRTAVTDPDIWAQQFLYDAMIRHGIKDPLRQRLEYGVVFGNRTAENVSNVLSNPDSVKRLNKDAGMIDQATGLGGAQELLKNDPMATMQAILTQWNNLLINLGKPNVADAVRGMGAVADTFARIAGFAGKHPKAVKFIGEAALVAAAVMAAVGTVALGAAAFGAIAGGGVVAGIAALVAGVTAAAGVIVALNWGAVGGAVKSFFKVTWDIIQLITAFVLNPAGTLIGLPKMLPRMAADLLPAKTATQPPHSGAPPPGPPVHVTVNSTTKLDGKTIARGSVTHLAKMVQNGLSTGAAGYDPRATLAPVGAGGAGR